MKKKKSGDRQLPVLHWEHISQGLPHLCGGRLCFKLEQRRTSCYITPAVFWESSLYLNLFIDVDVDADVLNPNLWENKINNGEDKEMGRDGRIERSEEGGRK